jgi:5-formyltetrahydrofolate cyclo-ligase
MATVDHQLSKAQLRRKLLKLRQDMPLEDWRQKSDRLCAHLQASDFFLEASTILAYFSFRQEPDLSPLFVENSDQYQWGFPRCEGKSLIWHSWLPGNKSLLQVGAYGIHEPSPNLPVLTAAEVDLILVPAIACDTQGYRLGYGGGFYDRLLSTPEWQSKPTIGIVFEAARLAVLPTDSWDRPLQRICTEVGLFLPGNVLVNNL